MTKIKSIQLDELQSAELRRLTNRELSANEFWKSLIEPLQTEATVASLERITNNTYSVTYVPRLCQRRPPPDYK